MWMVDEFLWAGEAEMAMQKEVLNDLFKKTLQLLLSYEIDTVGYIGLEHSDPSLTKKDLRVKATRLVLISDIFRQVFKVVASDGKLSLQEQTVFIPLARNFLRCIINSLVHDGLQPSGTESGFI